MKKNTAKIISSFLAVIFMISSVAYAKIPDISIERTLENGTAVQKLVVKGSLDEFKKGERATLKVYDKALTGAVDFDDYAQVDEAYVAEDGSYRFSVYFENDPATYVIEVNSLKATDKGEKYIPSLDGINKLISDMNSNSITAVQVAEKIAEEYQELAFDVAIFGDLDLTTRTKVITDMDNEISTFDVENIYESFGRYTLINALNSASDAASVKKAVDFYDEKYIGTSAMSVDELKKSFNKTRLDFAYDHMRNKGITDIAGVKNIYAEGFILSAYKNVDAYLNLYDVLTDYKNEIGIANNISAIDNSEVKNVVLRYLISIKNQVKTLEDLKNQYLYAISNVDKIKGSDSTAPSGGGGGGGGGGASGGTHVSVDPNYGKNENASSEGNFEIAPSLTDVDEVPWAEAAIKDLFSKGIVSGKGDGLYKPNDNVTRAEMTKMLVESMGVYNKDAVSEFSDSKSHWSNSYVASAYNKGYIYGVSDTLFGVDKKITRQDAAVIIYRIIQVSAKAVKIPDVLKNFTDMNDASQYAVNSIKMLAEYGVLNGFSDGSFKPKANLTRAEAAVVISNFLKYMEVGI